MIGRTLVNEPHITIQYDVLEDVLYADWLGNQTKESVMDGCEKILQCLQLHKCDKVLNDNTHVTSIWDDASEWVATDWFPRLHAAGCKLFAWVYSPHLYSKLSADKTISYGVKGLIVTTFREESTALAWLKAMA